MSVTRPAAGQGGFLRRGQAFQAIHSRPLLTVHAASHGFHLLLQAVDRTCGRLQVHQTGHGRGQRRQSGVDNLRAARPQTQNPRGCNGTSSSRGQNSGFP